MCVGGGALLSTQIQTQSFNSLVDLINMALRGGTIPTSSKLGGGGHVSLVPCHNHH